MPAPKQSQPLSSNAKTPSAAIWNPMPNERGSIDVQRLIAEVAARHHLFLKPGDPAIALVTMKQFIFDAAIETVHEQIRVTIANFKHLCRKRRSAREACWRRR